VLLLIVNPRQNRAKRCSMRARLRVLASLSGTVEHILKLELRLRGDTEQVLFEGQRPRLHATNSRLFLKDSRTEPRSLHAFISEVKPRNHFPKQNSKSSMTSHCIFPVWSARFGE